ncbi:hypothetical protein MAM1_0034d02561 [Mucor ambiguus]|uniref:Uncharacterized protein n=1 Tax=Mucor ambiguus TaxID=91626 RepID=A0A0C9LSR9_9FUNG|nr:hypothetical protein MAM1_0034d02561 [Mucor ambiguus]
MALSDNQPKLPKKATSTTAPKDWASVVRNTDNKKTYLLSLGTLSDPLDNAPIQNPYLKGRLPQSVFIDISNVHEQKKNFKELIEICHENNGDHFWGLEEKPICDGNRIFAEFLLSGEMSHRVVSEGIVLPSFTNRFYGFHSLSVDAAIMKISLSGLPRQYGRLRGGAIELAKDLRRNMATLSTAVFLVVDLSRTIVNLNQNKKYHLL